MRRAARAWAAGDGCALCPLAPRYPRDCTASQPQAWRTHEIEEDLECSVRSMHVTQNFFRGWGLLEKGILPQPGGWEQQPAYWIEAFEIIGAETARYYQEKAKQLTS